MTGQNGLEAKIVHRILAVAGSEKLSFRDLAIAGDFDLAKDFRFSNLSGLSFAGEDLRGIDFSGANLCGCDFTNALLEGALFCGARIGSISFYNNRNIAASIVSAQLANLRAAQDWDKYWRSWQAPSEGITDSHLSVGDIFIDGCALEMIVLPASASLELKDRTSRMGISRLALREWEYTNGAPRMNQAHQSRDALVLRDEAIKFIDAFNSRNGKWSRLPLRQELVRLFVDADLSAGDIAEWCVDHNQPLVISEKSAVRGGEGTEFDRNAFHIARELSD